MARVRSSLALNKSNYFALTAHLFDSILTYWISNLIAKKGKKYENLETAFHCFAHAYYSE